MEADRTTGPGTAPDATPARTAARPQRRSRNPERICGMLPSIPVGGPSMPAHVSLEVRTNALVVVENCGRYGRRSVMLGYVDQHDRGKMSVFNHGTFPSSNC